MQRSMLFMSIKLFAIVACVVVWFFGCQDFLVMSLGFAAGSFVSLYPQYRDERGLWMAGAVLLCLSLPMVIAGSPVYGADGEEYGSFALLNSDSTGWLVSVATFCFTAYASVMNYRLPPKSPSSTC